MLRSYALATSIVGNRRWAVLLIVVLLPQLDTTFGGDENAMINTAANASVWLSWVVNLLVVEWWLQRGRARRLQRRERSLPNEPVGGGAANLVARWP